MHLLAIYPRFPSILRSLRYYSLFFTHLYWYVSYRAPFDDCQVYEPFIDLLKDHINENAVLKREVTELVWKIIQQDTFRAIPSSDFKVQRWMSSFRNNTHSQLSLIRLTRLSHSSVPMGAPSYERFVHLIKCASDRHIRAQVVEEILKTNCGELRYSLSVFLCLLI